MVTKSTNSHSKSKAPAKKGKVTQSKAGVKAKTVTKARARSTKSGGAKSGRPTAELEMSHDLMNRVSSAMMVVNTDFIVQYVNKATMDLFARHADSFKKLFPDFNPAAIIGTCIDGFHIYDGWHYYVSQRNFPGSRWLQHGRDPW